MKTTHVWVQLFFKTRLFMATETVVS